MEQKRYFRLHVLLIVTFLFSLSTILFGAATTSTNSGMAFEDVLTSDGQFFFAFDWSKIPYWTIGYFEHHHRELASTTGLLTVVAWFLFRFWVKDEKAKVLMNWAMIGVIFQGVLGMLTVFFDLKVPAMSIMHAIVGQVVVALYGVLVLITSRSWLTESSKRPTYDFKMIYYLPWLLIMQLLIGACYRHMGKVWWFLGHAAFAMVVTFAVIYVLMILYSQCKDHLPLSRLAKILTVLLIVQLALGFMAFSQRDNLEFTKTAEVGYDKRVETPTNRSVTATLHVLVGALMLVATVVIRTHAKGGQKTFTQVAEKKPEISKI